MGPIKMKWWAAALMFGSVLLASCSNGDTPVSPDDANDMGNAPSGVRLIDLGLPSGTKWANMDIGAMILFISNSPVVNSGLRFGGRAIRPVQ